MAVMTPARTGTDSGAAPNPEPKYKRRTGSHVFLLAISVYFMLPLWWLVVASTKDNSALFDSAFGPLFFDDSFSLFGNIKELFTYSDGIYWRWMGNSFFYAITAGVGSTIMSVLAGYGFAKYEFKGRNLAFSILLGSVMIPATTLVIPTFILLSQVNIINTPWAVILPSLMNPMGVYIMRVYVQDAVPPELIEAARVDGAGEWRTFFTIALPLLKPAIVTVLLLAVVGTWNNYFLPVAMLSDTNLLPVTVGLGAWQTQSQIGAGSEQLWNLVVTGAMVSIIPLIISFLGMQRFWRGGLALGSVK